MLGTGNNTKILRTVIRPIFVDMVDVLGGQQWSAEHFLHNGAVLSFTVLSVSNTPIPLFVKPALGIFHPITAAFIRVNEIRVTPTPESRVMHSAHPKGQKRLVASSDSADFHADIVPEQSQNVNGKMQSREC